MDLEDKEHTSKSSLKPEGLGDFKNDSTSTGSLENGCCVKGVCGDFHTTPEETHSSSTLSQNNTFSVWEVEVPKHLVGRLIGKQGKHIGFVKKNSGAKMFVSTLPFIQDYQICHIEGSKEQVDCALALIRKKFKDLDLSNQYGCCERSSSSAPCLTLTSWLQLPHGVNVFVAVAQVETGNYLFVHQPTHPTFSALGSLTQQMLLCYSQPGCPSLPSPVEAGVICAAPAPDGSWWRAQVIKYYKESGTVQLRYVDYGGYVTISIDSVKQIRTDFISLPFQATEVMLENVAPLPGEDEISLQAKLALEELTRGVNLLAQVTSYYSGIPLIQMWRTDTEELVSVNRALVDHGLCSWAEGH
ncbi:A-kinase anchor protein 1, mitochondrial-like [Denticeps clupeoides]|uniref:A-kinase anchor protein 1, mitochondrial-like n=1 Tax=Denticeps clupeoides TaxID=299321 RepID=UPI0010A4DEC9|nr:A-kinase anchor protein 1, mitochondrial-like [Denticeps clupeoides]